MTRYLSFAGIKFRSKLAYRFDYVLGILNSLLAFVVYWSIYKALYGNAVEVDGVTFFNFKLRMLSEDMGGGAFNVAFNFLPTVIIACLFAPVQPPSSLINMLLCVVSVILGYIVLWEISFIVQSWSFTLFSVWGLITIKNVMVNILAGAFIPMWFMPDWLRSAIRFTPFDSIYFTPVQIYLGELNGAEIAFHFARQVFWIAVLWAIGEYFWRSGIKKLVVQGG